MKIEERHIDKIFSNDCTQELGDFVDAILLIYLVHSSPSDYFVQLELLKCGYKIQHSVLYSILKKMEELKLLAR